MEYWTLLSGATSHSTAPVPQEVMMGSCKLTPASLKVVSISSFGLSLSRDRSHHMQYL